MVYTESLMKILCNSSRLIRPKLLKLNSSQHAGILQVCVMVQLYIIFSSEI